MLIFNLPPFDFIFFETSNPSVRDSVNCILTCIRSKQNQKQKNGFKKKTNTQTHTQTQHKQCPSTISLVSFANHAVCSILMIIMSEYNLLFFVRVLR